MAARLSSTLLRTQTDKRLLALAAQGSEPAFEALVERYRRPLQSLCRRMLLDRAAAEDVVQQAFLSTWQALRAGTEVREARAWLYRVTHNTAINALKKSGYDHAQLDEALRGAGAPEEDLERRVAIRRTLAGLAALPELQREALLRTAVEGHSHEDVARALGLSDHAVRGLVYRARVALRTSASALTPAPLVQWAASGRGGNGPLGERIAELVAGGGTAGASALVAKGGATLLTAGALAGGVAVVETDRRERAGSGEKAGQRSGGARLAPAPAAGGDVTGPASSERPLTRLSAGGPSGGAVTSGAGGGSRRDRSDSGARGSGRDDASGSGSGSSSSGAGSGSSGSGSSDDSGPGSTSSGSGSGSSGSGSGSSGSGSGSGSSGSGSESSGSGSGDHDDNSGPGSTSSGSGSGGDDDAAGDSSGPGSGSVDDSSGSGSSGSGSGDDSSGSGSSGSGSSGSGSGDAFDSSGSGSSGSGSRDDGDSSGSGSGDDPDAP